jgi:hypothetical protein
MTKQELTEIIKVINLLSLDGSNTKKQARDILIDLVPNYKEK